MGAPRYVISQNENDSHQRSPCWVVAFVSFAEPASAYSMTTGPMQVKQTLIVENDVLSVSIQNSKGNFAKSATIQLKPTDVFYLNRVSPGDYVFVWMHDSIEKADEIVRLLQARNGAAGLTNWYSGFKFFGRVLNVSSSDQVSGGGMRPIFQTVTAQAFIEMASSVYYSDMAQAILSPGTAAGLNNIAADLAANNFVKNGMDKSMGKFGSKLLSFFEGKGGDIPKLPSPDVAVAFMLVIAMGVDRESDLIPGVDIRGEFSDAIDIPGEVATIFGRAGAKKLWQVYNVYLGLQEYSSKSSMTLEPWKSMSPNNKGDSTVFRNCPIRCKGIVPFKIPPLSNVSLWSILGQYLNPTVNEMYTVLRCDENNRIRPTIMIREQPFGTGLFPLLERKFKPVLPSPKKATPGQTQEVLDKAKKSFTAAEKTLNALLPANHTRAMYFSHPRWVIDETMLKSISVSTDESRRCNFTQVWGTSLNVDMTNPQDPAQATSFSAEHRKEMLLASGNFVSDDTDISRNGLRADIQSSEFDYPLPESPYWARMRADWLFNGHLKANATVTLNGVWEPICEGDNCEIRGIVYHIESVTHTGTLAKDGKKSFVTQLVLSRGILAESLVKADDIPKYLIHKPILRDNNYAPGVTDMQFTSKPNRDKSTGEYIKGGDED